MSRDDWGGRSARGHRRDDLWDEDAVPTATERRRTRSTPASPPPSRSSRHSRRRRWGLLPLLAGLVALALLLGIGAWALLRDEESGTAADGCAGSELTVAVTPELSSAVESALDRVTRSDPCARFQVDPLSSSDVASRINAGESPDVWIPDSSTWVDAVDPTRTAGQWIEGPPVATSPIALAVGTQHEAADGEVRSWGRLLNDEGALQMANPDVDTASRLAYHASRIGQPRQIGLDTGSRLIVLSRFAADSAASIFSDYAADPKATSPFPASEQAIAAWNVEHDDLPALDAVLPRQGTLTLDYPWITNPRLAGDNLRHAESARAELSTPATVEELQQAGFRSVDGTAEELPGGVRPGRLVELKPLSRTERIASVEQWDVLRTDMRMLPIIDVSGSMRYDSPTKGLTRFDVAKGALLKGLSIIPAGSKVGGWVFSSDTGGKGVDHKEIAPIERLDRALPNGRTHRDRLKTVLQGTDKYVEKNGDTGLYDSVWAGYQKMTEEYDDEYVNSVVVVTDGENDDPNGGLTLRQLLTRIDGAYDRDKPVRIITIGMGEASPTALQKISDESGGTSYIAETPDDIERVFVQALLARRAG